MHSTEIQYEKYIYIKALSTLFTSKWECRDLGIDYPHEYVSLSHAQSLKCLMVRRRESECSSLPLPNRFSLLLCINTQYESESQSTHFHLPTMWWWKMVGGIRRVERFLLVLVQFGGCEEFSDGFHMWLLDFRLVNSHRLKNWLKFACVMMWGPV